MNKVIKQVHKSPFGSEKRKQVSPWARPKHAKGQTGLKHLQVFILNSSLFLVFWCSTKENNYALQ